MKKYKILIIACIILAAAAGGWFWHKNVNDKNKEREKEKTAFTTGFTMLDNEKDLAWSEIVNLDADVRAQFENKVKEINADLGASADKETRLADYNNLAIYEKYLGNYRESYSAYLESLKLKNGSRITWQNFADVLLKIKAHKSAEFAYKKAIDLNKYIPESYVKLADYYKAMNNDAQVEATYKLAIETIKQSMESEALVLSDYADWLADKKRYGEAIKVYQELEVKQPGNKAAVEKIIERLKTVR